MVLCPVTQLRWYSFISIPCKIIRKNKSNYISYAKIQENQKNTSGQKSLKPRYMKNKNKTSQSN